MAGFFKNLMDSLKLQDDDEAFDEFDTKESSRSDKNERTNERIQERPDRIRRNTSAASEPVVSRVPSDTPQVKRAHTSSNYGTATYIESHNNKKTLRMERPEGSKVVPIKTTRDGLEVCVMKPRNFEDSQDICDVLLSNCVAIVNLEDNDITVSQRIMDFISGAVYSINGKLFQISDLIFITAPGTVDVSGDYNDILAQTGYDVPILVNKGL